MNTGKQNSIWNVKYFSLSFTILFTIGCNSIITGNHYGSFISNEALIIFKIQVWRHNKKKLIRNQLAKFLTAVTLDSKISNIIQKLCKLMQVHVYKYYWIIRLVGKGRRTSPLKELRKLRCCSYIVIMLIL